MNNTLLVIALRVSNIDSFILIFEIIGTENMDFCTPSSLISVNAINQYFEVSASVA